MSVNSSRGRLLGYGFTIAERVVARDLVNQPYGSPVEGLASGVGVRGLRSRRMVAGNGWAAEAAPSRAARRLVEPFSRGALASLALARTDLVRREEGILRLAGPVAAFAFVHRYLFTGVHAVTLAPVGGGVGLTEHRRGRGEVTMSLPGPTRFWAGSLVGVGLETDERRAHIPLSMLVVVADSLLDAHNRHPVHIDLDGLWAIPAGTGAEAALRGGYPAWMPMLVADALDHLQVAPDQVSTPEAYVTWAEASLRLPVRCGGGRHVRTVDPHTGHTHIPKRRQQRYAAEHTLAALTAAAEDGPAGCDRPYPFLTGPVDANFLSGPHDEDVLRRLVRAVQYLDAGLDLHEAVDFLRLGLTVEQARALLVLRRGSSTEVTSLLFAGVRHLNRHGTLQPLLERQPVR